MMKGNRFRWQVAQLFRGQVLYSLAQFLVLALLSRFGGDDQSGAYVLALATTAPVFLFLDLDLRTVRSTDQKYPELFQSYLGLRLWCVLLASLISLSIGCLFFRETLAIFAVVTLFRIGDSLSNLGFGGFQRMMRSELIGKSLAVKGIIATVVVLIVAWLSGGSAFAVGAAMATIAILAAVFWDLPRALELNEPTAPALARVITPALLDFSSQLRIAKRALPLGMDACLSSLILNIPKYCVHAFLGIEMLGVFGLLMQLAYSVQLLIGAVGHTGVTPLAELRAKNERKKFWQLIGKMAATSLAVGILATVFGTILIPKTFSFLLGPEYNQPLLVTLLLIASSLTGTQRTVSRATQACGSFYSYMMFDVIIFSGSLVASYSLVEPMGLVGAATALVIAFGVGLIATLVHTRYLLWPAEQPSDVKSQRVVERLGEQKKVKP